MHPPTPLCPHGASAQCAGGAATPARPFLDPAAAAIVCCRHAMALRSVSHHPPPQQPSNGCPLLCALLPAGRLHHNPCRVSCFLWPPHCCLLAAAAAGAHAAPTWRLLPCCLPQGGTCSAARPCCHWRLPPSAPPCTACTAARTPAADCCTLPTAGAAPHCSPCHRIV